MKHLVLICPYDGSENERYNRLVKCISSYNYSVDTDINLISTMDEFNSWINQLHYYTIDYLCDICMVYLVHLDMSGINLTLMSMLKLIEQQKSCFGGMYGGIIIDGENELHTKNVARQIAFAINQQGCIIPGNAFAEATGSLKNQRYRAKNLKTSPLDAFYKNSIEVIKNLLSFKNSQDATTESISKKKNILCIYAGNKKTSNTYAYWALIKENLKYKNVSIEEINLQNGEIYDCLGCPFEICQHYSENSSCFYGGVIVEKVYPAIKNCDALVILCPNYNDSVSANIMAFINRLTALYRNMNFNDKYLFSVIVSGYSGGDILSEQLIGALNFNKGFILPSKATQMITANEAGEILKYSNINETAQDMSENICYNLGL